MEISERQTKTLDIIKDSNTIEIIENPNIIKKVILEVLNIRDYEPYKWKFRSDKIKLLSELGERFHIVNNDIIIMKSGIAGKKGGRLYKLMNISGIWKAVEYDKINITQNPNDLNDLASGKYRYKNLKHIRDDIYNIDIIIRNYAEELGYLNKSNIINKDMQYKDGKFKLIIE